MKTPLIEVGHEYMIKIDEETLKSLGLLGLRELLNPLVRDVVKTTMVKVLFRSGRNIGVYKGTKSLTVNEILFQKLIVAGHNAAQTIGR